MLSKVAREVEDSPLKKKRKSLGYLDTLLEWTVI